MYLDPLMTIEEAVGCRDFTINAIAWDSESHELRDAFDGIIDLEERILRHTTKCFKKIYCAYFEVCNLPEDMP